MTEPSPRASRLVVAAAIVAVGLLGGGGFLLGRMTVPEPPPTVVPVAAPTPEQMPETPGPPPARVLGRAEIIGMANSASDAASSARPLPEDVISAENQRFEIYLPFGCDGPSPAGGNSASGWRYDNATSSLRVSVASVVFEPGDWLGEAGKGVSDEALPSEGEGIEGFWVSRPWSSSETCKQPVAAAGTPLSEAVVLPGQTLGLAQIFTPDDPRTSRRGGKPYETVSRSNLKALDIDQGLRLRLRGRIARFPNGAPVRCRQPGGREQRPICLIAVTFDEVAIDNPATGETIATWPAAIHAKSP